MIAFFFGLAYGVAAAACGFSYAFMRARRIPDQPVELLHPPGQAGHTSTGGASARGGPEARRATESAPEGADLRRRELLLHQLDRADHALKPFGLRTMAGGLLQ